MTVTDTLINILRQQVEAHCTVVWYDPEQAYFDLAHSLSSEAVAQAAVHHYDPARGFVGLRHDLEPLWAGRTEPPRLIIYVPLAQADTHRALIEFEVAGVVVQPGQQPPERNTALVAVARQALQAAFPPAKVEKIVAEVEAGQWTVNGLDHLIEKGDEIDAGVLAEIFGSGNLAEVATGFLARSELDVELEARQALGNLAGFLADGLGISFPTNQGPTDLRRHLARQLLLTDLLNGLGEHVPAALKTFPVAEQAVARQAAVQLAQTWRNRRDISDSYVQWANQIQAELGPAALDLPLEPLAHSETFALGESQLQTRLEKRLLQKASANLVELAASRRDSFWAAHKPDLKTRWEVIVAAGQVLVEAARVEQNLKGKSWSADLLLANYALADAPWCLLDTAQRHLERDFHRFDLIPEQHQSLQELVAHARQRYSAVANQLAASFTQAYEAIKFELPNVLLQTDVYHETITPLAKPARAAYILVDALRFEMARELLALLEPDWQSDLTVALATPPTVTEIGMAALLPGAERGVTIVPAGSGKLAAVVGGETLKSRQDRLTYFRQAAESQVATAKLDQLAPLTDTHLRQELEAAQVVLVTATEEIDTLCENTPVLARRMLDDVLNQLRRGLKTLFGLGLQTVVITADHGYLFGEKLSSGHWIDPPSGQRTASLKRRVWLGQGGAEVPGTLRRPLSAFGLGGELELVTPYNLSCFKVAGGSTEYFHGGLSLPELVIPVLTVRSAAAQLPTAASPIQWGLTLGSKTISTVFTSVTVEGQAQQLFLEPPLVRLEVRVGDRPISTPISASYGFNQTTKDTQLQAEPDAPHTIAQNTITLQITDIPEGGVATVHLLDAASGLTLYQLENVPLNIMEF